MEKENLEWGRALLHMAIHIVAVVLIVGFRVPDSTIDLLFIIIGGCVIALEIFMITGYFAEQRGNTGTYARFYHWFYIQVATRIDIRESEQGKTTAMFSYLLGLALVRFVLQASIIELLYVMTILSWADPAARVFGKGLKGPKLPKNEKHWSGVWGFLVVGGLVLALLDVLLVETGMTAVTSVVLAAQGIALFCAVCAEVLTSKWDNLWISLSAYGGYKGALAMLT